MLSETTLARIIQGSKERWTGAESPQMILSAWIAKDVTTALISAEAVERIKTQIIDLEKAHRSAIAELERRLSHYQGNCPHTARTTHTCNFGVSVNRCDICGLGLS